MEQRILTLPRVDFTQRHGFQRWADVEAHVRDHAGKSRWVPRPIAERHTDMVQPIAAALVFDAEGNVCVLRRGRDTREDLKSRLSLIIGGHVDHSEQPEYISFSDLDLILRDTLRRELREEIALEDAVIEDPIGIVIDQTSAESARHIGFIYLVSAQSLITVKAAEEYSVRSIFDGKFFTPTYLSSKSHRFDPWSKLLIQEYFSISGETLPITFRTDAEPITAESAPAGFAEVELWPNLGYEPE